MDLDERKKLLLAQLDELQESIAFIDEKQDFFNDILSGKVEYSSNLIEV